MIKKALLAMVAVGALSVPLAGAAWAEPPSDSSSTDNGIGEGGMPQRIGDFAATGVTPPLAESNAPIPPGEEFNLAKGLFKDPGESTPDAIRDFEAFVWTPPRVLLNGDELPVPISNNPQDWENITPGLAIKPLTPGCGKGRTGLPDTTPQCVP